MPGLTRTMKQLSRRKFFEESIALKKLNEHSTIKAAYKDPSNTQLPRHLLKTSTGIAPYSGTFGEEELRHLLKRTLFGISYSDLTYFKNKSLTEVLNSLLTIPDNLPEPPLNHYSYNPALPDPDVPAGSTWVNAPVSPTLEGQRRVSFKGWWAGLQFNRQPNIREKMTLFWHNHFATESAIVLDSRFVYKHHSLLRQNCLGNFKELVRQVCIDPAMLVYLNGKDNTKTAPDENFARELQELFTVGKDLPNHYTEEDVRAAAKVLTGWRINRNGISSSFDPNAHDTGNKQFSAFYNNTVIQGRSGSTAGTDELNDLMTMLFNQQEVSKYICRKLYRYFVYYVIDESVEKNVIEPLATVFRNNNYQIKPVLETLLKSEHFFDPLNRACMIKSPSDYLVGLARNFQLALPGSGNIQQQYTHFIYAQQVMAAIGQDLGDPPSVAGWPSYYEDPQFYELWINSDTLPKRNQSAEGLLYTGFNRQNFVLKIDTLQLVSGFSNPSNPNELLNDALKILFQMPLSASHIQTVKKSFLLGGQEEDHYWTDAWAAWQGNPGNVILKNAVESKLKDLFKYLTGLAEYQLC